MHVETVLAYLGAAGVIVGIYAVHNLGKILNQHLQRQNELQQRILVSLEKCSEQLDDIKESFFFSKP